MRSATVDDGKRQELLAEATELAIEDGGDHSAALPGEHLGLAQGHQVPRAHRRAPPRYMHVSE